MLDLKELPPVTAEDLDQAIAERSLFEFEKQAWRVIEPTPFVPGWHIEVVCNHLEAVTRRVIRNLIINIPPRHTKSLTTSVMWPAWTWGPAGMPDTRWLCMSYGGDLSIRDSVKCRTLIQSNWYQKRWGGLFNLTGDQNAKERYNNTKNGYRIASSIGGMATGEGGDIILIDDPHNLKEINSELSRKSVIDWWDTVMPTRLNDQDASARVIIMQRSHFGDLVGHIKDTSKENWEWLVLPAEFEDGTRCETSIGFIDPRTEPGQLLWPARFNEQTIVKLKRELGSYAYAGQFQQRPSPVEGGIFKRHWWQFYLHQQRPVKFDFLFQTWDMAFKDLKTSDYVSGQVWGQIGANFYLLDNLWERLDFVKTLAAVERMTARWPDATAKFVEDKANGTAVINMLKSKIPGLIAINPEGSKISRAFAVSPLVEAGNVWVPHPSTTPWVNDWLEEMVNFPNGAHDDQVDAFTQGITQASKRNRQHDLPPIVSNMRASGWSI